MPVIRPRGQPRTEDDAVLPIRDLAGSLIVAERREPHRMGWAEGAGVLEDEFPKECER